MSRQRFLWAVTSVLLVTALGYALVPQPALSRYQSESRAYFDSQGRLLRLTLADDDRYRLHVDLDDVSPALRQATLLYEDRDYYQHPGIDPLALLRAAWTTYVTRDRRVGASTITMQVARLRWRLDTRDLWGKLVQISRAVQLTRHYSKDDIFQAYLNLASYGGNIEGVEAASLIYFDKHAKDLTPPEALSLSVIPQNPVKRSPTTTQGLSQLLEARSHLFQRWCQFHPDAVSQQVFFDLPPQFRAPQQLTFTAPHFITWLDLQLPTLRRGALNTTLNRDVQNTVEQLTAAYLERRAPAGLDNAAVLVVNSATMAVEAMLGSADFWDDGIEGQVNGTTAKRSPGSTLKPFVYGLAMDQGLIHPLTMLKDSPHRFAGFSPENYDQKFLGPVFARDALILSRNVPATVLQARLAEPGLHGWLQQAGVEGLRAADYYGLALSLGGAEVTMVELVRLYALLANGGELKPLRSLMEQPQAEGKTLLSPEASFLVLDILRDNPPPQRPELLGQVGGGVEVAWKTGTSFAFRDAWAVGVSGPYVIAVWLGHFDGHSNPALIGRLAAGPLLFDLFEALGHGQGWTATERLKPGLLNLRKVAVCREDGALPNPLTPHTVPTWFIPGVSPIQVSQLHRQVAVDRNTGLRACRAEAGRTEMKIYEFWPSDLLRIFRLAGVALAVPPPFEPGCSLQDVAQSGAAPRITAPLTGVTYQLRSDRLDAETIALTATTDGDVQTLYWFADDGYLGRCAGDEPFLWQPRPGEITLRVVDDHGRAAQKTINVALVRDAR
nr:penicillin-binding protein 1C [uncultured Desulfuromonas sp.]